MFVDNHTEYRRMPVTGYRTACFFLAAWECPNKRSI